MGMRDEIELEVTISGPADAVMRDVRRLREPGLEKRGALTTLVKHAAIRGAQERYTIPPIVAGDASAAMETLDKLANQARIGPELERRLDELIQELGVRTKP
jgi:hypothetical protein